MMLIPMLLTDIMVNIHAIGRNLLVTPKITMASGYQSLQLNLKKKHISLSTRAIYSKIEKI